jgi:F0F1-type ATP synthase delta subunit
MRITPKQYAQAWYASLTQSPQSEWDAISASVIRTIHRQGKMKWLSSIVAAVERLENAETGVTSVTVRTAHSQNDKMINELVQTILGDRAARVKQIVDPELIAGAQVETENSRWDFSLRGQLRNLEKTINA